MADLYGMAQTEDAISWIVERGGMPLILGVSGSHMWSLNNASSDLDIRGIYRAPTEQILSLHPGRDTIEGQKELGGLVDLQLYEVGKAFRMLEHGNGNLVELLLAPTIFYSAGVDWAVLAQKFLTKRLAAYYRGFYHSQRKRAAANRGSKALVYTYREIMSGIWLMRTGEIVHNFADLRAKFENIFGSLPLLAGYLDSGRWREPMSCGQIAAFEADWARLEMVLDEEMAKSTLPDSYNGTADLDELLLELRGWSKLRPMQIKQFARACGGVEVHRSWRDNMLAQEREVAEERMSWETLPEQDKELDKKISEDVLNDYATWVVS